MQIRTSYEIAQQVTTNVVIIEDEPLIAMDLERLVEELGHQVSRIARTHRQAVAAVKAYRPGLVLTDIQLADGSSGLEAVNELLIGFEVRLFLSPHFRSNCSTASVLSRSSW